MRVLVAVFSRTFNTLKVANAVKEAMGADLTRIEPAKDGIHIVRVIMAMLGLKTPIKSGKTDLRNYDLLVLCTPVWSNSLPPAVNQYIAELTNAGGKKFAVVVSSGSGRSEKPIGKARSKLTARGMQYLDSLGLRKREVERGEHFQKAAAFADGLKRKAVLPLSVTETVEKVSRFIRLLQMMSKFIGKK